ncbi:hypothetical protein [Microbacterium sp. SORGH_AS_0888]|uniref:hypothetical protein n=1 Tax=Microbacterium sp. SORGH_AS_0888 TaxID=3041791 RepID=UPI0027816AD3|nr:hypothetical protein [Microbacterium sp. SORGH_AS_0888]MDQ1130272.1 hypothetical protein [Microbacterium sp. SORGH_AS_0888]
MSTTPSRTAEPVLIRTGTGHALSALGWRVAVVLTAALILALIGALGLANALPFTGERATGSAAVDARTGSDKGGAAVRTTGGQPLTTTNGTSSVVTAEWDGPAINLDWNGLEYARAEAGFVGDRVAVPGDRVSRTLEVVNAGPGSGEMLVTLGLRERVPAAANNPQFGDDVILFWEVNGVSGRGRFSDLAQAGRLEIGQAAMAQGATARVLIGFEMPRDVESSRSLGAESTALELFGVTVDIHGEAPRQLAVTGSLLPWVAIYLAIALLLGGLLMLLLRRLRRRVCDECDCAIHRSDPHIEIRETGRRRRILCTDCATHVLGA